MSPLQKRRVAKRYQRKLSNSTSSKTNTPAIIYNPYTRQLQLKRKSKATTAKTPQFKFRRGAQEAGNWIGDQMDHQPLPTETRFILQNCNGLSTSSDLNIFKSDMTEVIRKDIHFLALPEINVNCANVGLTNGYKEAFAEITPNGIFQVSNSKVFESRVKYQPGGVGTGFFGKLVTRLIRTQKEKYGRWQYQEFQGKQKNLRVYTVYRANYFTDNTTGDTTAWAQQRLLLLQDGIDDNPRHRVIHDLIKELQQAITIGCSVIVLGDMNEHICGSEQTNDKLYNVGLVNLFQERLGDNLPNTHRRGSKAIDHIYVTPNVMNHVQKAGIAPFNYGLKSDHRALLFDLDLGSLLDPSVNVITPYHCRRLKTTDPKRMEKYLDTLNQQWDFHKIDQRIQRVATKFRNSDSDAEKALNDLDEMITNVMRHAEKNIFWRTERATINPKPPLESPRKGE